VYFGDYSLPCKRPVLKEGVLEADEGLEGELSGYIPIIEGGGLREITEAGYIRVRK